MDDTTGQLTPGFSIGSPTLDGVQSIEIVERGGAKLLVTIGFVANNIAVYEVEQTTPGQIGDLSFVTELTDADNANLLLDGAF
ncbi:MAG: hypothetical protein AAF631_12430 [Pseudomonadota bacterium]